MSPRSFLRVISILPPSHAQLRHCLYTPVYTKERTEGRGGAVESTVLGLRTATPVAADAAAAPSAIGVFSLTARPAADPTNVTTASTATQTRVWPSGCYWSWVTAHGCRRQETLPAFDQACTTRLEGQTARSQPEFLQPSLHLSSFNGHRNLYCNTPSSNLV